MDHGEGASVARTSRYRLVGLIARGGMGEVFEASMTGPGGFEKPVVIKRILPRLAGQDDAARRFADEARLMCRLSHPNIVSVLDFGGGDEGDHFLVLELVRGMDLRALSSALTARSTPMPVSIAVYVATQVLRGLHFAHTSLAHEGATLVHRDVSPHNVLLSRLGEVKVADFGIAAVVDAANPSTADVSGKPMYMSPEQFDGAELDARSDVFSAGVLLFEALGGELPFGAADDLLTYRTAARDGHLRRLRDLRRDVPAELEAAVSRALESDPARRFADAREMEKVLLAASGSAPAGPDELAELLESVAGDVQPPKPVRRLGAAGGGAAELARDDGGARFTLHATGGPTKVTFASILAEMDEPGSPRPPTERIDPDATLPEPIVSSSSHTATRKGRPWAIVAVVGGLSLVAAWAGRRLLNPESRADDAETAPSAPVDDAASASAAPTAPPMPARSARDTPPLPPPRDAPTGNGKQAPPGTPSDAQTPAKPDDCRGELHIYAGHGWMVTGGPASVEAPGKHLFPCGTYGLTARSRVDDSVMKSRTVVVKEGQPVAWDLR